MKKQELVIKIMIVTSSKQQNIQFFRQSFVNPSVTENIIQSSCNVNRFKFNLNGVEPP